MRCATHQLAAGPDGLCVVCRRGSQAPDARVTRGVYLVMGGVFGLVAAAGLGYRVLRDRQIVADVDRATRATTAPLVQPDPAPTAPAAAPPSPAGIAGGGPAGAAPAATADIARTNAAASVRVVVYTTPWCPHCKRAKAWLASQNIAYEERDVEASRAYAAELRAINPRGSIPTFDVDGETAIGFEPSAVLAMRDRAAARRMPR